MNHLAKHAVSAFLVAIIILATAVSLSYVEEFFRLQKRPEWLCLGVKTLEIGLFIVDGIVLLGTSAVVGWRVMQQAARD